MHIMGNSSNCFILLQLPFFALAYGPSTARPASQLAAASMPLYNTTPIDTITHRRAQKTCSNSPCNYDPTSEGAPGSGKKVGESLYLYLGYQYVNDVSQCRSGGVVIGSCGICCYYDPDHSDGSGRASMCNACRACPTGKVARKDAASQYEWDSDQQRHNDIICTSPATKHPTKHPTTKTSLFLPTKHPTAASSTASPTTSASSVYNCTDTPGWINGYGKGCKDYPINNWCAGGKVLVPFAVTATFRNPIEHCCACGKDK